MSFTTPPTFAAPILLLGLIAVPLAALGYKLLEDRRSRRAAAWANPDLLPNIVSRPVPWVRHVPAALFLIGLALLLVGFARPQQKTHKSAEGATIVLAFDISGSMATTDVKPTRAVAARNAALAYVKTVPLKYKIAVETFSDHVSVPVPPTYDRVAVAAGIPSKTFAEGTSLSGGIAGAVNVATTAVGATKPGAPHAAAAVLLFSDGNQTDTTAAKPSLAAVVASKAGIPISTVSIGTPGGSLKQKVLGVSITRPTPTDPTALQLVAKQTKGLFFDSKTLGNLPQVTGLVAHKSTKVPITRELTALVVGVALVFMLAGMILSSAWFRRVA